MLIYNQYYDLRVKQTFLFPLVLPSGRSFLRACPAKIEYFGGHEMGSEQFRAPNCLG